MGHTIWIELKGDKKGATDSDNSIICKLDKELDQLATKLGVTPLTEFCDYTVLESEYSDGPKTLKPKWSDSIAGLESLFTIYAALQKDPKSLKWKAKPETSHWPEYLREELRYCVSVLIRGVKEKKKFRLLIVP